MIDVHLELRKSKSLGERINDHGVCADVMQLNDSISSILTSHVILHVKMLVPLGDLIILHMLDINLIITINRQRFMNEIHNANAFDKNLQPLGMLTSLIACNILGKHGGVDCNILAYNFSVRQPHQPTKRCNQRWTLSYQCNMQSPEHYIPTFGVQQCTCK